VHPALEGGSQPGSPAGHPAVRPPCLWVRLLIYVRCPLSPELRACISSNLWLESALVLLLLTLPWRLKQAG